MRRVLFITLAAVSTVFSTILVTAASAAPLRVSELTSRESVLAWMAAYRTKPAPAQLPAMWHAVSKFGGFRDVDAGGVFVGFAAGVLGANPAKAEELVNKMLAIQAEDHWAVVRAVAYSGLPQWKALLAKVAARAPARKPMIDKYLAGKLPTLDQFAFAEDPGVFGRMRDALTFKKEAKRTSFDPHPDLIDTYWGYYFATGAYSPIGHLVTMVAWAKDRDNVEKLTLGSMAKYTLSLNAARDGDLLSMLKWAKSQQPKETAAALDDLIDAAETADTPRLRKEALAAIEELKRKGPGYKRDVTWWGQIGQGALALGCIGAAAAGQVELGLPCVLTGAFSSAGLYYWGNQQ